MMRLLDTNHAIAHLNDDPRIVARLTAGEAVGGEFALATPVLGELYYGAYASQRIADNLARLTGFASQLFVFDFDAVASEEFGKIRAEQRAKGKPIPTVDIQIAAIARFHGLTLLTNDRHFDDVDGLSIENWLA